MAEINLDWANVARRKREHYQKLLASPLPSELALHVAERQLAEMVPHLAEQIDLLAVELERVKPIADDAQYDFGAMACVEGECDHAETHDVPCPLVEQRYATAEDVLELHRLRTLIERVKELTVSTDGDPVDNDAEIPVGEIVRVLAESESARAAL